MIGNVIQSLYLEQRNYPEAAALSFLMMAAILAVVSIYLASPGPGRSWATRTRRMSALRPGCAATALLIYAGLAVALHAASRSSSIALFSFEPEHAQGKLDFTWDGFTLDYWKDAFAIDGGQRRDDHQPPAGGALDRGRDGRSAR